MRILIKETLLIAKKRFHSFRFTDSQTEQLLNSGRRDLEEVISELDALIAMEKPDIEALQHMLHALKGLLHNMGNTDAADIMADLEEQIQTEQESTIASIRQMIQEYNEKALLTDETSEKNTPPKYLSDQMQELVQEETEKNLEKQILLELKSCHIQMGELIGMSTHQWKQPLNVINLLVNVLKINLAKESLGIEDVEGKLNDILKQVSHMNQTVNNFQNFFTPIKEKITFNLYENIQAVLNLVKYVYLHKHIDIALTGNTNIMAYGFPNEFNHVIFSLLENAKKAFAENPRESMHITIEIFEENNMPQITVTDNAGGIPEEMLDRIFDLYASTKQEGSGLGLHIAKSMIEKNMGGKIEVKNVEGGSRFSITLPPSLSTDL